MSSLLKRLKYFSPIVIKMLRCSKCKQEKDESEFYKSSKTPSGYRRRCKSCCSEANKAPKHKELIDKWRKDNPDKVKEYKKKTYNKHHDKILEKRREYTKNNKEKIKISRKKTIAKKPYYYTLYKVFAGIRDRCNNKNNKMYSRYGGRGIKCLRETYECFYSDMYPSYMEHIKEYGAGRKYTQIDRIDNDGNYCKENCRRVTAKENNPANKAKENLLHK